MSWFSRNRKVTAEQFAELVSEALRGAGFDVLETNLEEFTLRGSFGTVNLTNFINNYNVASDQVRKQILAGIVESATVAETHQFPAWEQAAPHLRVVVRSDRFHQLLALIARAEQHPNGGTLAALRPLVPGLLLELAYDTERVTTSVPRTQLEAWGVTLDEAMDRAVSNLRDLDELPFKRQPAGFYVAGARDGYETGRMATPDQFHRLELAGDPVVIPGVKQAFLLAGSRDEDALVAMAETALDLMQSGQWVSFNAFVHDGSGWAKFRPDFDHPVYDLLRKLELIELREDYESQRPYLARLFGKETFVSQLIIGEREGRVRSFATWGEGVTPLLPAAESIVFSLLDPDDPEAYGEMIDVPFDDALEIVGHRLARLEGVEPVRYCAESFPSAEEIEELRARSDAQNLH